jgi:hypothetical protein
MSFESQWSFAQEAQSWYPGAKISHEPLPDSRSGKKMLRWTATLKTGDKVSHRGMVLISKRSGDPYLVVSRSPMAAALTPELKAILDEAAKNAYPRTIEL